MSGVGAAEAVDRLRVVAHDREPLAVRTQQSDNIDLDPVHVLVLIDQHPIPPGPEPVTGGGIGQQGPPVDQQVIEVEQTALPLAGHKVAEQAVDRLGVVAAPGKLRRHHLPARTAGVDRSRVHVGQRTGAGQPHRRTGKPVLLSEQVEQIDHIAGVEHRHLSQPHTRGKLGDQPVPDRVERAPADPPPKCRITARRHARPVRRAG